MVPRSPLLNRSPTPAPADTAPPRQHHRLRRRGLSRSHRVLRVGSHFLDLLRSSFHWRLLSARVSSCAGTSTLPLAQRTRKLPRLDHGSIELSEELAS